MWLRGLWLTLVSGSLSRDMCQPPWLCFEPLVSFILPLDFYLHATVSIVQCPYVICNENKYYFPLKMYF